MFLIITRDTMFFTAMKNILSKGNVVHIQNEEEIDVMLHQNAFVIIDTLMNNVFHSNFLTQIERLIPVHVIIFSPFNIKNYFSSSLLLYKNIATDTEHIIT